MMRKTSVVIVSAAIIAAVGHARDVGGFVRMTDTEYELKWDNGTIGSGYNYPYGSNVWIGNDYDISTLKSTHNYIRQLGIVLGTGPNGAWDGIRIGIWAWPGNIIWPESGEPMFVKPTGGTGWYWFDVNWILPPENSAFLAGAEQYYDPPNCDAIYADTGPAVSHSWMGYGSGSWFPWPPNNNLMVRVRYSPDYSGQNVEPTSIGRVKALYY